ncbi:hypothetical protein ACMHYO_10435 [Allopusillimonas ginsengisoli]|uniref:hypothetical protein n=1 Tax=Allopusillimonas ginsengisoli TaxID=453575 RepID=UPI0010C16124|nr:hypothetical protein D7I39_07010 [Allopusillimonas ginsengisoli]
MPYHFSIRGQRYYGYAVTGGARIRFHRASDASVIGYYRPGEANPWPVKTPHTDTAGRDEAIFSDLEIVGDHINKRRCAGFIGSGNNAVVNSLSKLYNPSPLPEYCVLEFD